MRKFLISCAVVLGLTVPASAQVYIGPEGFSVGPLFVPNPNYYAPPPSVYVPNPYIPPPYNAVPPEPPPPPPAPPPSQSVVPFACYTNGWDGFVAVRAEPRGLLLIAFANGVPITAFNIYNPPFVDYLGYPWVPVITTNGIRGWSFLPSLVCNPPTY